MAELHDYYKHSYLSVDSWLMSGFFCDPNSYFERIYVDVVVELVLFLFSFLHLVIVAMPFVFSLWLQWT